MASLRVRLDLTSIFDPYNVTETDRVRAHLRERPMTNKTPFFGFATLGVFAISLFGCATAVSDGGIDSDESYGVSTEIETTVRRARKTGLGVSVQMSRGIGRRRGLDRTQSVDRYYIRSRHGWSDNSGLNWDEKYQAWVSQLAVEELTEGYIKETFTLLTPHGKRITAPVLECAEVSIFLRAAFAAWYHLPFYLEARDAGRPIYLGHFGFSNADGSLYNRTPSFKRAYRDYSAEWQTVKHGLWMRSST